MNIKNSYLKAFLLIIFIAINIFPGACFSWGPGIVPERPLQPPTVLPSPPIPEVTLNGEAYIKALECVETNPKANSLDKTDANILKEKIRSLLLNSKDGNVPVSKTEINDYTNKFPDCNFSALIK